MKHIILITFVFFYSYSSAQTSSVRNEIKDLMISCYNKLSEYDVSIKDEILKELWNNSKRPEDLIAPNYFAQIQNFDIKKEDDLIKFDTLFTSKEFLSMKQQIKNFHDVQWSNLIGKKYVKIQKKGNFKKYFSFSAPAFSENKLMAIIYVESSNSGELRVYRKNSGGIWEYFANGLIWRTD